MSFNNSVCSISKDSSIYDAINIIINEEIEELLVWDETLDKWVWMLTIADAIRLIMHSLKTIIKEGKVSKVFVLWRRFYDVPEVQGAGAAVQQNRTVQQVSLCVTLNIGNRSTS